ncbi:Polyketide cyclase / dehydrase and lipid transport [Mycolicibacterium rutilum]|uniref:Polyketide cyclase / dehydrase and lipid transport n=1 Tax=Mycolicibacterium rutilum TaxID=370526 RepID=A0A1H6IY38_MYCRU|nr:SRPBCC family protein [Mycolicibacterium rutilum]SEH54598.1 Polyketide cyclase / dehydrase and lipid transport [Mycolicibacterium rutilum]
MTTVYFSKVLRAPLPRVWEVVSDFGSLPMWFPFVTASDLVPAGAPRQVGAVRTNQIDDGTAVVEKLTELSDRDHRISYDVIGGDAPVRNYSATLTVYEVSDTATCFVTWIASFDAAGDAESVAEWVRNGIFRDCLAALEKTLLPTAAAS